MGDPRKSRSNFKGPKHPWQGWRIEEERIVKKEYGLKNKREIWKANSELRRLNGQAKKLIRARRKADSQSVLEQKQLLDRLCKLGLVSEGATLEDVLALELKDILDRRLQTIVHKSGLSLTAKQSRQFIIHGNIFIDGKKMTVPSYLVPKSEEFKIGFNPNSSLSKDEHPERMKKAQLKEAADRKKKAQDDEAKAKESPIEITEEDLVKIEKEIGEVVVQ